MEGREWEGRETGRERGERGGREGGVGWKGDGQGKRREGRGNTLPFTTSADVGFRSFNTRVVLFTTSRRGGIKGLLLFLFGSSSMDFLDGFWFLSFSARNPAVGSQFNDILDGEFEARLNQRGGQIDVSQYFEVVFQGLLLRFLLLRVKFLSHCCS